MAIAQKDSSCARLFCNYLSISPCAAGARFLVHFPPRLLAIATSFTKVAFRQRNHLQSVILSMLLNQPTRLAWQQSNATVPCFPYALKQVCVCFCFAAQLPDAVFCLLTKSTAITLCAPQSTCMYLFSTYQVQFLFFFFFFEIK